MSLLLSLTAFLALACIALYYNYASAAPIRDEFREYHGTIDAGMVSVVDGDTFFLNGKQVRVAGVDAAERDQVCNLVNGDEFPCAEEATNELRGLLSVGRELDCIKTGVSYGRTVMQCYVDEIDIGYHMVRHGHAVVDTRYTSGVYEKQLLAAQDDARRHALGVWRDPNFEAPKDWRERSKGDGH